MGTVAGVNNALKLDNDGDGDCVVSLDEEHFIRFGGLLESTISQVKVDVASLSTGFGFVESD